jgi:predicted nucleic acid-binding protein
VAEPPASNASPLIVLARAGHLRLLRELYGTVIVPGAVVSELLRGPASDAAAAALQSETWLKRTAVGDIPTRIATWDLGLGEAEVLAWALEHPGCEAILDNRLGRRCARALGVLVRGTLGVVLLGKKRGVIPAARPVMDALVHAGLFLAPDLREQALRLVGE